MDSTPGLSKSRTEKFHKLFKTVPEHETPMDFFSCAFIGDILLQGNLYVSQNWFCFYSRIKGRGRKLEIPMESVISITREKTAIIFPNAIGLQTKNEKYAFGSFIARDSVYRFLVSCWKKSHENKSNGDTTDGAIGTNTDTKMVHNDSTLKCTATTSYVPKNCSNRNSNYSNQSHSKTDSSDQSDYSIPMDSFSKDISDLNDPDIDDIDLSSKTDSSPVHLPVKSESYTQFYQERKVTISRRKEAEGKNLQFPYSIIHSIDRKKTAAAFQESAVKLQKIPRTSLLLSLCTILVVFLLLSAVALTYKILDLEAQLSSRRPWSASDNLHTQYKSYKEVLNLQSHLQDSTAQHVQRILAANVRVLDEINSNLDRLKKSCLPGDSQNPCFVDD
ncbi:GRAM domain-containing protein 2B-like [Dreissena polymorpha]|uniref:GRAM domain-containing protein n=1 Tax=Dreissena polymorpha TaxID=45954 RepID=A0A9D4QS46_DREPO|nr:GRAM domain-containing protein 2B-like [Dreissena polymorpha]KAH3841379.1 hypothetical protein DPMN_114838 [Dreissena polymorpha]